MRTSSTSYPPPQHGTTVWVERLGTCQYAFSPGKRYFEGLNNGYKRLDHFTNDSGQGLAFLPSSLDNVAVLNNTRAAP